MGRIAVVSPDGTPEVRPGDDLAGLLLSQAELVDGSIAVVTSKVVSKAEGRVVDGNRDDLLASQSTRIVARRGPTTIVRTAHGLTMAAAGIDASNVETGKAVLLPEDPDASARRIREGIAGQTGANVGVIITDTAGRAWREGQTDIAIGAAGLTVLVDHSGEVDPHGNPLMVTAPAVADEIAGLAELAQGKLTGRPFAVVVGRSDLVLPLGQHGTGARALIRSEGADMFGFGSREAVIRAVRRASADLAPFGESVPAEELDAAIEAAGLDRENPDDHDLVAVVAFAHGWVASDAADGLRLRPATP